MDISYYYCKLLLVNVRWIKVTVVFPKQMHIFDKWIRKKAVKQPSLLEMDCADGDYIPGWVTMCDENLLAETADVC